MEPKIIGVTPAGRKRYLEILVPYLLRERSKGTIAKHHFWINTVVKEDLQYLNHLKELHPDFFELIEMPEEVIKYNCERYTHFYRKCCESNTIYIKIDDDICWLEDSCIKNLINCRIDNKEALLIFGNTINNPICTHIHQRFNALPIRNGLVEYLAFDNLGWNSGKFAEFIHKSFLRNYSKNNIQRYYFPDWYNWENVRISINMIAWWGDHMKGICDHIQNDDEQSLSSDIPFIIKSCGVISGSSLAVHFAYRTQREYLENKTTLLSKYKRMSSKV